MLTLQENRRWYVGQAESLMDYKEFTSMVRIGYVIKSNELNFLRASESNHFKFRYPSNYLEKQEVFVFFKAQILG